MSSVASNLPPNDSPVARARFQDPENFFAFKWPTVPRSQFLAERDRAFASDAPSGQIELDASDAMAMDYAATTPMLLARYIVIRANDSLAIERHASAELFYVFHGQGESEGAGDVIHWREGDVFCFPGGVPVRHAGETHSILFSVCNEPLLRLEALRPAPVGHGRVQPVHWRHDEMQARFESVFARPDTEQTAGRALQLSSAAMQPAGYPVPTMNVAINTLEPGGDQRPHRHNGAAITLAIQGQGVYSMIEDEKVDWSHGAAQVTPAAELHSHHNRGPERMRSLVVQDEGLHFYARTPGFSWT